MEGRWKGGKERRFERRLLLRSTSVVTAHSPIWSNLRFPSAQIKNIRPRLLSRSLLPRPGKEGGPLPSLCSSRSPFPLSGGGGGAARGWCLAGRASNSAKTASKRTAPFSLSPLLSLSLSPPSLYSVSLAPLYPLLHVSMFSCG